MDVKPADLFKPEHESGKILMEWWVGLEKHRGDRAQLCRARSPVEIVFSPSYHRLHEKLWFPNADSLALVAGVCAHVKMSVPGKFAEQMASGNKDKATVSGLRFRRLLAINDRNELYLAMIRIIRLLGGVADIYSLAQAMYWWNERTKKQWAFDYYGKAPNDEK